MPPPPTPDPTTPPAPAPGAAEHPPVSVIMPVLDEGRHLAHAVTSVLAQDYPGQMEVVIAVGPSRDNTREVAHGLAARDPRVVVVDNPTGRTPDGLNAALAATRHLVIVRMDGHGELGEGYVRRAVQLLHETGAANVGGIMLAEGTTTTERAIACAMRSPLGVGGARFHVGGRPGPSKTVYLGVFRRAWLDRVGGYDGTYARAQDWEMNHRIRQLGGLVWFDPSLTVTYRPRPSIRALARQYYRTGRWRRRLMAQHPETASVRYLAPPAVVVAVGVGALGGFLWRPMLLLPAGYAVLVALGGATVARHERPAVIARMPGVLATMHLTWGAGFLVGSTDRDGSTDPPA